MAKHFLAEAAYIAQNPEAQFFSNSVREEILSVRRVVSATQMEEWMNHFSLPLCSLGRSPFLLSEGEKRRLSIMLGMILDKPILLYDEPTFGLDPVCRKMIEGEIANLKKRNTLQVIVTHNDSFAMEVADTIYRFEGGALWEQEL
jgi:energy-coupling factor transport system ATP-binding protein